MKLIISDSKFKTNVKKSWYDRFRLCILSAELTDYFYIHKRNAKWKYCSEGELKGKDHNSWNKFKYLEDGRNKDDRIFNENVTIFLFLIQVEWLLFKWVIRIQEMKKKHI